jgi:uroporphyrinogen decarboxylase
MGGHIQAIAINSDLGSQIGPLCRPALWEELCAPFVKAFCDFIHQNSDLKIFLHSCGSIQEFIPALIECGVDIFNPVQITAENMDPRELKQKFGDKVTFWGGGCDTQRVLNMKTPEEVSANVRELIRIFKPGGGFVFNQVHNVMGDVKPENIVAMLDTAYEESF